MKRTTLVLGDDLYAALKARAAAEGRTLTEIVERTLRLGLGADVPQRRPRVELPSYDLGPFLIDLTPVRMGAGPEPPPEPQP